MRRTRGTMPLECRGTTVSARAMVLFVVLGGFVCPAAFADAGIPIAPVVGIELWLYVPFLLLIETAVVAKVLGLGRKKSFRAVLDANAVSTVAGFPLLLLAIFAIVATVGFAANWVWSEVWPGWLGRLFSVFALYWAPSPYVGFAGETNSPFKIFQLCATLIWVVVAFAVSVVVEEWVFLHCRWIDDSVPRRRIHRAVLVANLASYAPLVVANVLLLLPY